MLGCVPPTLDGSTPDVRNQTGMQQSSSFLFCSFFSCCLTKEEQRSARTQTVELIRKIEGLLQTWSSTLLQVTSVCAGIFQKFGCLLKQRLYRRQASRHCHETLSKCNWHEPRAARMTYTLSLFCFCVLVTSKHIEQKLQLSRVVTVRILILAKKKKRQWIDKKKKEKWTAKKSIRARTSLQDYF